MDHTKFLTFFRMSQKQIGNIFCSTNSLLCQLYLCLYRTGQDWKLAITFAVFPDQYGDRSHFANWSIKAF